MHGLGQKVFVLALLGVLMATMMGHGAAKKVSLTVAHAWPEEVLQRQTVFDESFTRAHPEIDIIMENHPWGEVNEKMKVRAAAGTLPDVLYVHPSWAAEWWDMLIGLDQFVSTDPTIRLPDIVPTALYRDARGSLRGIGYDSSPAMLFYRTDLFDQAGLPHPDKSWTYQEHYRQAARKLTVRDGDRITRYGAAISIHSGSWGLEGTYYRPFGGRVAELVDGRVEIFLDQPASVAAAQWWNDLVVVDGIAQFGGNFAAGEVAMAFDGPWFRRWNDPRQIDYDVAHMPAGPITRVTPASGSFYSITSACKNPDAAWEYLKAYVATENQRFMWASVGDAVPSRRSAWDAFLRAAGEGAFVKNAVRLLEAMGEYAIDHAVFLGIEQVYKAYNEEYGARARTQAVPSILTIIAQKARAYVGQ